MRQKCQNDRNFAQCLQISGKLYSVQIRTKSLPYPRFHKVEPIQIRAAFRALKFIRRGVYSCFWHTRLYFQQREKIGQVNSISIQSFSVSAELKIVFQQVKGNESDLKIFFYASLPFLIKSLNLSLKTALNICQLTEKWRHMSKQYSRNRQPGLS